MPEIRYVPLPDAHSIFLPDGCIPGNRWTDSIHLGRCAMHGIALWRIARTLLLPALLFVAFGKTSIIPIVFTNEEIRIDFGGQFEPREKPGKTQYPQHLPQPLTTVDFCPWRPQPPEVQQVMRPERGFLCELHILPGAIETKAMAQIQSAHAANKERHVRNFRLQATDIGGHRVIRWRFQAGKTRLDHYLLIGKKFNYLFVSSPYGSNGAIEELISRTKFR